MIENPRDIKNIGTIIRNVNGLGVEKTYIVDSQKKLPDNWQEMRERSSLSATSVSAIKWSFVTRFDSTEECLEHLEKKGFISIVTSPHIKGKKTVILHEADYTHPKVSPRDTITPEHGVKLPACIGKRFRHPVPELVPCARPPRSPVR